MRVRDGNGVGNGSCPGGWCDPLMEARAPGTRELMVSGWDTALDVPLGAGVAAG